jgi:hypothetical protein
MEIIVAGHDEDTVFPSQDAFSVIPGKRISHIYKMFLEAR